jgi:hypothetical protein
MAAPSQYDVARKRAQQQSQAATQSQQDAIKRRFASMGGLASGAAMKQQQLAAEKAQEQLGTQLEGIDAAEAEQKRQEAEIEKQRQFSREERLAGEKFASGERAAGQAFAETQAQKERDFNAAQADISRKYATGERIAGQEFTDAQNARQLEFQKSVQAFNETQAGKEYQLALDNLALEREAQDYNIRLSQATAAKEGIVVDRTAQEAANRAAAEAEAKRKEEARIEESRQRDRDKQKVGQYKRRETSSAGRGGGWM